MAIYFFTNIGPELSQDIAVPTNASIYDYLGNRNNKKIFLTPVSEEEVVLVVDTSGNSFGFCCDHPIYFRCDHELYNA